jgi:hypothetical protein
LCLCKARAAAARTFSKGELMFGKKISLMIALSIAALTVAPASATTIATYTDLASWTAAASGTQLLNFENGCLTSCLGVSFIGLGGAGTIGIYDTTTASWINFGTGKAAFINTNSATTIRIVVPTMVTAFGFNLFSANPNSLNFTISTLSSTFNVTTNPTPTPAFFGGTSDTPFNTIDVKLAGTPASAYALIDNFQFGTAAAPAIDPAPEAATFLLIGSGLIGLMGLRNRIMKNKTVLQSNSALNAC